MLIRISAPHFVAGVVSDGDKVTEAAPIVKYMKGWALSKVYAYCMKKYWKIEVL